MIDKILNFDVEQDVINETLYLFDKLDQTNFKYAYETTNKGIMLHFVFDDYNFVAITINPDLTIDMDHEKGFGANYDIIYEVEGISLNTITEYLKKMK